MRTGDGSHCRHSPERLSIDFRRDFATGRDMVSAGVAPPPGIEFTMPGSRPHIARSVFVLALALNFLVFANLVSSLHTCYPLADADQRWERSGASGPDALRSSPGPGNHPPASRGGTNGSSALDSERGCLGCLSGAQLRILSTPATTSATALAETQRIPREPRNIPALSRAWIRVLPRAPPADTAS